MLQIKPVNVNKYALSVGDDRNRTQISWAGNGSELGLLTQQNI